MSRKSNQVVLVDFGSAWTKERTARRAEGDGFTHGYAAPELYADGARADARTDQFSVSVIGYETFGGCLPFEGLGGQAGLPEYRTEAAGKLVLPSLATRNARPFPAEVWRKLDQVITRGLAFDIDERFPTSHAWLDAIEEIHAMLRHGSRLTAFDRWIVRSVDWLFGWCRPRGDKR